MVHGGLDVWGFGSVIIINGSEMCKKLDRNQGWVQPERQQHNALCFFAAVDGIGVLSSLKGEDNCIYSGLMYFCHVWCDSATMKNFIS